ncbi:MAG: hypothetical protein V4659_13135 [Pseudomonadota bacterium]
MNWGLFLALIGFLLPVSLILRVGAQLAIAGLPFGHPIQTMRIILLLTIAWATLGKTPTAIYAVTGDFDALGRVTEAFMLTGWGIAQTALMLAAVVACDVFAPGIVGRLDPVPAHPAKPSKVYLRRDLGVFVICLLLAWIGQR